MFDDAHVDAKESVGGIGEWCFWCLDGGVQEPYAVSVD